MEPVFKDSCKVTKLIDKFDIVRYTLTFLNFNDEKFIIKVKEYNGEEFPKEIIKEEYSKIEEAEKSYSLLIDDYSAVVRMNQRDIVPAEEVFEHSVGYHEQEPDCCAVCKFSMLKRRKCFPFNERYICFKESNVRTFNKLLSDNRLWHEMAKTYSSLHPEVSPMGICKNFQKAECPKKPRFDLCKCEIEKDKDWKKFKKRNPSFDFIMETVDVWVK